MARYKYIVNSEVGERVDVFLTRKLDDLPSRSFLKKLIEDKKVKVNGENVKVSYRLNFEDYVEIDFSSEDIPKNTINPEKIPIDVFYEDDALAIINKPIGLTVHPMQTHTSGTLVNALLYRFKKLSDINGEFRPGIVHRLDKETSGLIVIAKNNQAHQRIVWQFQKHRVLKQYVALVQGSVDFQEGEINAPIAQSPKFHDHRIISFDDKTAKEATTVYKVIKRRDDKTLVKLYPKTGRTHQLRLHMRHLGHPILGDAKYGSKQLFPRLALHAQGLGFMHPMTKKWVEFVSAMPEIFLNAENVGFRDLKN